jgi:predicted dehydrogenase
MALDLAQCQQMMDVCQHSGVKLAIGHSLRFWGAFLTCRQLVEAGAIGTPVSGSIDRMSTANVTEAAAAGKEQTHWRDEVANTGGKVLEGFIHELDFSRAVFGEVASVTAQVGGGQVYAGLLSPEIMQAVVGFESGALVTLRTGSTVALPTRGYWIGGTEGGLRFTEWGGPIEHYRTDFSEKRLVSAKATNAYYLELCDFLQAVEKGGEPENSPLNGKKNIALGLGIYYSFETSRRLEYRQGMPVEMPVDYQNTRW